MLDTVLAALLQTLLLTLCAVASPAPQDASPPPVISSPVPKPQYFSGFVTEMNANSVSVTRKGSGKDGTHRSFVTDTQTKIEGKLRVNARVTVRYESTSAGDRAIRIIVR